MSSAGKMSGKMARKMAGKMSSTRLWRAESLFQKLKFTLVLYARCMVLYYNIKMQHRIPDRASNMVGHVLRNAALYFVWEHVLHIPPLCSGWGFPLDFTLWNCNWKQQRLPIPFAILIFSICSNVRTCLTVLPSMPDLEVDTQSHADHHDRRLEAALQRCWRRLAGLTFSHGLWPEQARHWYAHPICLSASRARHWARTWHLLI